VFVSGDVKDPSDYSYFPHTEWSAVAQWLEHRYLKRENLYRTLNKFVHSTLLQFIDLYDWMFDYKHW